MIAVEGSMVLTSQNKKEYMVCTKRLQSVTRVCSEGATM